MHEVRMILFGKMCHKVPINFGIFSLNIHVCKYSISLITPGSAVCVSGSSCTYSFHLCWPFYH